MTTLIIARHGNTFESGETPRRVGARTDLPLTAKGRAQSRAIGEYLKQNSLLPDAIYTSHLQRTIQTAQEIQDTAGLKLHPQPLDIFNEVDYGPDENKTEDDVIARIGQDALTAWEEHATLPSGWSPDVSNITAGWSNFAEKISRENSGAIIMVVTSNGIARFALGLAGDFATLRNEFGLKLATGAFGILDHHPGTGWAIRNWNIRP